jgi:hypothetical protein
MNNKMLHSILLEKGGIKKGDQVRYSANEESN